MSPPPTLHVFTATHKQSGILLLIITFKNVQKTLTLTVMLFVKGCSKIYSIPCHSIYRATCRCSRKNPRVKQFSETYQQAWSSLHTCSNLRESFKFLCYCTCIFLMGYVPKPKFFFFFSVYKTLSM